MLKRTSMLRSLPRGRNYLWAHKWPSTIGWTCAFDAKIRGKTNRAGSVNAWRERNKKNFEFFHFWFALSALLIENHGYPLTRAQGS
jgi:hypothetical protein